MFFRVHFVGDCLLNNGLRYLIKSADYSLSHPGIRLYCSMLVKYPGNGVIVITAALAQGGCDDNQLIPSTWILIENWHLLHMMPRKPGLRRNNLWGVGGWCAMWRLILSPQHVHISGRAEISWGCWKGRVDAMWHILRDQEQVFWLLGSLRSTVPRGSTISQWDLPLLCTAVRFYASLHNMGRHNRPLYPVWCAGLIICQIAN
jgi:hypothetical protein